MLTGEMTNAKGDWRIKRHSHSSPVKLLLIDDEPGITKALKTGLELNGFEVTTFNDPLKAVAGFKPGAYDAVLTDLRMPGMTGFQVWDHLRKKDRRLKVTFMSAYEEYKEEFHRLKPSLDDSQFLQKPIALKNLVERLKLRVSRPNRSTKLRNIVARPGFEPGSRAPKAPILDQLDDRASGRRVPR